MRYYGIYHNEVAITTGTIAYMRKRIKEDIALWKKVFGYSDGYTIVTDNLMKEYISGEDGCTLRYEKGVKIKPQYAEIINEFNRKRV